MFLPLPLIKRGNSTHWHELSCSALGGYTIWARRKRARCKRAIPSHIVIFAWVELCVCECARRVNEEEQVETTRARVCLCVCVLFFLSPCVSAFRFFIGTSPPSCWSISRFNWQFWDSSWVFSCSNWYMYSAVCCKIAACKQTNYIIRYYMLCIFLKVFKKK